MENFLYILHSSGPGRVQRHQCYTICSGRGCCKKATVPYLPIRPLQFTGGSPKRVKLENFLYILRSSGPRRVHRHQSYTTYWGRSWCKKSTVPYLPIRPLHFTGGQKLAHTRVNLGPSHISETITGRKLKFYTHIDRSKYTFKAWKFPPLGGVRLVQHPLVQIWDPPRISETSRARRLKFYTQLNRTKCGLQAWQFSARVQRGVRRQTGRPQVAMPRNCHVF